MMIWIRRILVGMLVVVGILLAGIAGIIGLDSAFGASAEDYANVTFTAEDGTTLVGYLAQPTGDGPFPGVLMVHEWWGLNAEITEMADELAQEGYVVLAPDTYRGATTQQIPRAIFLRVTVPEERVNADMQAAFDYLAQQAQVADERIGVMGFCYGGGVALRHAVNNPQIAATVNLYGDTILAPDAFGALLNDDAGPVLGIFGAADQQIPVSEVRDFEAALVEAGIAHTVTIYDEMPHAFVQPDNIDVPGAPRDAWQEILAFFERTLAPEPALSTARIP